MRTTVIAYVGFITIFLQLLILSTIVSHSAYSSSIEDSLEDSITYAISMLQVGYSENVEGSLNSNPYEKDASDIIWNSNSPDAFKSMFLSYLTETLDSRITDLNVNIYGADAENGILSVEVKAKFNYIDGKQGTASCYRTAILNTTLK